MRLLNVIMQNIRAFAVVVIPSHETLLKFVHNLTLVVLLLPIAFTHIKIIKSVIVGRIQMNKMCWYHKHVFATGTM